MADFDSYIKKLTKVKIRRERLAQWIQYNCETTKRFRDWQLPIFNRNDRDHLPRIDELKDKTLFQDLVFSKLIEIYNKLDKLVEERGLIWRADFPSENPDRLRLDSKIRSFDVDVELMLGRIFNREMKESEYNSLLDESHKIYKQLSELETQINNFSDTEFSKKYWQREKRNK